MSRPLLGSLILKDLWQHKLLLGLAALVLLSAGLVVEQSFRYRELVSNLDALSQQQDGLMVEWRHLLLEENALAEHSRVEQIARKQLLMIRPTGADGKIVEVQ